MQAIPNVLEAIMDGYHHAISFRWKVTKRPEGSQKGCLQDLGLCITNRLIYQCGFHTPCLRFIMLEEENYVLSKIYEGVCGNHLDPRSLALKVVMQGYYWPITMKDAVEWVKKYDKYQHHSPILKKPVEQLSCLHNA